MLKWEISPYLIGKQWHISLDRGEYSIYFRKNIKDILEGFTSLFLKDSLDLFFLIAWNDMESNWDKLSSFLVTETSKGPILNYMYRLGMQELNILGTTSFVFKYTKFPAIVLIFELGESFGFKSYVRDGAETLRVTLGKEDVFDNIASYKCKGSPKYDYKVVNEVGMLTLTSTATCPDEDVDSLRKYFTLEAGSPEYLAFLERLFRTGNTDRFNTIDGKLFYDGLLDLHKTLSLVYTLLQEIDKNKEKELVYIFHSLHCVENSGVSSSSVTADGGCFCLVQRRNQSKYLEYRTYAALALSKISAMQKIVHIDSSMKQAQKSAIAAIMARNMSHNIGSHVLSRVALHSLTSSGEDEHIDYAQDCALLASYLQQRMDFIAQITTELPSWSYPYRFVTQLMRQFFMQQHLLNYVAVSEKLGVSEVPRDGGRLNICIKCGEEQIDLGRDFPLNINNNDPLLAVPGGVIGTHAFFIILENIIRNAAKHSSADPEAGLTITIVFSKVTDGIKFIVFENRSLTNGKSLLPENWRQLKPEQIRELPLHQRLNIKICDSLTDDSLKLKPGNWGLAEMKISACFLKQKKLSAIASRSEGNLEVIKAISVVGFLGYEFVVPEPRTILVANTAADVNTHSSLNYEFVVINGEAQIHLLELLRSAEIGASRDHENLKADNIETELLRFPARLFVFNLQEDLRKKIIKDSFLRKRIAILDSFDPIKTNLIDLYDEWLRHIKVNFLDATQREIQLCLKLVAGGDATPQYWPKTLPEWMRFSGATQAVILGNQKSTVYSVHHFNNYPDDKDSIRIYYERHHEPEDVAAAYSEYTSGASFHFPLISEYGSTTEMVCKSTIEHQLVENGLLRIAVADERVVDSEQRLRLRRAGVILIDKFFGYPLRKNIKVSFGINDKQYVFCDGNSELVADVLIVHQGILDKLDMNRAAIGEMISKLKEKIPYIFVTTGRGKPMNLPDNAKIIPFADVQACLMAQPHSKFALTQMLMCITSGRNE